MSLFPAFRRSFIQHAAWKDPQEAAAPLEDSIPEALVRMAGCGPAAAAGGSRAGGPSNFARPLMLDLNTLPRDDAPPSESVLKRQKFAVFEKHCSQVAEGLFVSGEAVARDRTILAQNNISHVVNCVGALYPEYFKADGIQYKTLWLQDSPQEDITCVLYDTFDFIEAARNGPNTAAQHNSRHTTTQQQQQQQLQPPPQLQQQQQFGSSTVPLLPLQQQQQQQQRFLQQQAQQLYGSSGCGGGGSSSGHVLVHCSQGVSRSTTIAIAYLMWKTGGTYDEVYQAVRALRGVTSPNVGFMCQLINWAKRRQRPPTRVRLYRISPHCADSPLYLVPKAVSPRPGAAHPDWSQLDPRGCFVAHLPHKVYVWRGQQCSHAAMQEAGLHAAAHLARYEGAPAAQLVRQGEEPQDLLAALAPSNAAAAAVNSSSSSTCNTSSCCTRADSLAAAATATAGTTSAVAAAGVGGGGGAGALSTPPAAAAAGGCGGSGQQQQQPQQQQDVEMTSAPDPPGVQPSNNQQQQEQVHQQQLQQQQQRQQTQQQQQSSAAAADSSRSRPLSGNPSGAAGGSTGLLMQTTASEAAAAAAAAQVLLGVQLGVAAGPAAGGGSGGGGLRAAAAAAPAVVVQQVPDYDSDYELWASSTSAAAAAAPSSSHQHKQGSLSDGGGGGRSTPRSPKKAGRGGGGGACWDEVAGGLVVGSHQSPRTSVSAGAGAGGSGAGAAVNSPASLEGRNRKYSRSDSEGRSVVPSCRQPGRLSTSSSQAWPDSGANTPAAASAAVAVAGAPAGAIIPAEGLMGGGGGGGGAVDAMEAEVDPAEAGVADMRQSSTAERM